MNKEWYRSFWCIFVYFIQKICKHSFTAQLGSSIHVLLSILLLLLQYVALQRNGLLPMDGVNRVEIERIYQLCMMVMHWWW